jgi:hypothetical protein
MLFYSYFRDGPYRDRTGDLRRARSCDVQCVRAPVRAVGWRRTPALESADPMRFMWRLMGLPRSFHYAGGHGGLGGGRPGVKPQQPRQGGPPQITWSDSAIGAPRGQDA